MNFKFINTINSLNIYFPYTRFLHSQYGRCKQDMSEVILDKPNNVKRRTRLIRRSDTTRTNSHWPLAFSQLEDLTNACLLDNKKAAVLQRLDHANEMLKDARKEIIEAVLVALEMKEAGDDIADQMLVAMVAQDDIRNAEITIGQTRTKMMREGLRKEFLIIPQDVVVKDVPFEDRLREAEKPLFLARYE
jgi:hypothetical protein